MRRSICVTQPASARAGEKGTWQFHYTTATPLPKGTKIRFDVESQGRESDWEIPSCNVKDKTNVIYALLSGDRIVKATLVESPAENAQFEFVLPAGMKLGEVLRIVIGSADWDDPSTFVTQGNRCQLFVQRRHAFHFHVDPKGKGLYSGEPESFLIDIRGSQLQRINILSPSFVTKNKRFDITVRFEDAFGNLTNSAPEGTLIDLSYEHLRENLSWKLFVPETGFVVLPNLYFNEPGIYRICLKDSTGKVNFISSPIKCFAEAPAHLSWGLLHGESDRIDSIEDMEGCLRQLRDEKGLSFFASSPFTSESEISNDQWKALSQSLADFSEEDRFLTLPGMQYLGKPGEEGLRQFLYIKDHKPILRPDDPKTNSLVKIYKNHNPREFLSIPSFTSSSACGFDFEMFHPDFERVVEIYNSWGSSECSKKEGNPFPIMGTISATSDGLIQRALQKNCRFGFVAGGLDDRGVYEGLFGSKQVEYSPGLTAVFLEKQTREGLLDALYRRACYATTGSRIILGFHIAGAVMGSELNLVEKKGLAVNRHISGYVAGTCPIRSIELLRNGTILHTWNPKANQYDYEYDDMQPFIKHSLSAPNAKRFLYYYVRVTQEDGAMAWSSPIWVDESAPSKEA